MKQAKTTTVVCVLIIIFLKRKNLCIEKRFVKPLLAKKRLKFINCLLFFSVAKGKMFRIYISESVTFRVKKKGKIPSIFVFLN